MNNNNRKIGNNESAVNEKTDSKLKRVKSFGNILSSKITLVLNLAVLLVNIGLPIYREIVQKPLVDSDITQSNINITKEYPFFETNYLQIESSAFSVLSLGKPFQDSLYTDDLKNCYVAKTDLLKLGDFYGQGTVVTLAIKQIGGSIAKDVTVDYICVHAENGLPYYVTTEDDVQQMDGYDHDVKGKKTTIEHHSIRYGDIVPGRGLIMPLFEFDDLKSQGVEMVDCDGHEVWSITGKTLLVPVTLSYKNIYDDSVKTIDIRKMNNSSITHSLYIEGRG